VTRAEAAALASVFELDVDDIAWPPEGLLGA